MKLELTPEAVEECAATLRRMAGNLTPVVESLTALIRRLGELGLLDALPLDDAPDGCWADLDWSEEDEEYEACDRTPVDDLGLCAAHAAQLRMIRERP